MVTAILNLSATQVNTLTNIQLETLTDAQVKALSDAKLLTNLSTDHVLALADYINYIPTDVVDNLTQAQVDSLSYTQLHTLTKDQVVALKAVNVVLDFSNPLFNIQEDAGNVNLNLMSSIDTTTISITEIPSSSMGAFVKSDGTTALKVGDTLTPTELKGLEFKTAQDANGTATLKYTEDGVANNVVVNIAAVNDAPVVNVATYSALQATNAAVIYDASDLVHQSGGSKYIGTDVETSYSSLGIALTSIDTTKGKWYSSSDSYYYGNSYATWTEITNVSNTHALLINSYSTLKCIPADGVNGDVKFSYHVWDGSNSATNLSYVDISATGATGGSTAYSTGTATQDIVLPKGSNVIDTIVDNQHSLQLVGSVNMDLSKLSYDHNLLKIDAKDDGTTPDTITLTAQKVLDFGVNNTIILDIDSKDTLNLSGWTQGATTNGYVAWTQAVNDVTATLNVHTAVI
ncbi:MAG: hypothetical protein WCW84_06065 [Sulfurimonas sp.]